MNRIKVKPFGPAKRIKYILFANRLKRGDLIRYEKSLIYCERRVDKDHWEFSCPWKENFILHRSEIERKLRY